MREATSRSPRTPARSTLSANYIAKWNGTSWSAVGGGAGSYVAVMAFLGADLFVGGTFSASSSGAKYVAKWDGSTWMAPGSSFNQIVTAVAVSGTAVYTGGFFTKVGGNSANYVASGTEPPGRPWAPV